MRSKKVASIKEKEEKTEKKHLFLCIKYQTVYRYAIFTEKHQSPHAWDSHLNVLAKDPIATELIRCVLERQ